MIAIIDYQMGNLRSVQKAFEKAGFEATITSDPQIVTSADKVVLPGVGAFEDAISELHRRGLVNPIKDVIAADKPFLGICLGLQLLFDVSYEGGEFEGLGIIPGQVKRFDVGPRFKVPHMGWNQANNGGIFDSLSVCHVASDWYMEVSEDLVCSPGSWYFFAIGVSLSTSLFWRNG